MSERTPFSFTIIGLNMIPVRMMCGHSGQSGMSTDMDSAFKRNQKLGVMILAYIP